MLILSRVLGLVTFLLPGLASHLRTTFLPIHVFSGIAVFVLAAAAALLGLTEKALFRSNDKEVDFQWKVRGQGDRGKGGK